MRSFSDLYDGAKSTTTMYQYVQAMQTLLMDHLFTDSECSDHVGTLNVSGDIDAIEVDTSMVMHSVANSSKPMLFMGIVYDLPGTSHYGGLFLDKRDRLFMIYDPSGISLEKIGVKTQLVSKIEEDTGYRYVDVPCYLDFQHVTRDRFCSMWTALVAYLVCVEGADINTVVDRISNMDRDDMVKEIGGFIQFMYNKLIELGLKDDAEKVWAFITRLLQDKSVHYSMKKGLLTMVKYSPDPMHTISALDLYPLDQLRYLPYVDGLYSMVVQKVHNEEVLSFIRSLSIPMDQKTYNTGVEMLYRTVERGKYLPYILYDVIRMEYPDIETFRDELMEISSIITFDFNRDAINRQALVLEEKVSSFLGLPSASDGYRVYQFINEFYIRYYLLDTYDAPAHRALWRHREDKYISLCRKYHVEFNLSMLLPPIRYVDIPSYIMSISSGGDMIDASIIRLPAVLNVYRERLKVLHSTDRD